NHIAALQLGFESRRDVTSQVGVTFMAKGAWGANFAEVEHTLVRGDGFQGPRTNRSRAAFAHAYELGLFADFAVTEQFRIKAGYQPLWLVDIPEASSQIPFNLQDIGRPFNTHGSAFFHGPMLEVQFLF